MTTLRAATNRTVGSMILMIAVIMSLAPFALVLINAFKSHTAIVQNPLALPESVNLANFRGAWKGANFTVGIGNSLILTLSTVFITVLTATLAALAILLLRTYVLTIPTELDDAALMDGASPRQIFWHVIVPLLRPGIVTVTVIVALNTWNEFLITSTFQQGNAGFTMTLGYRAMAGAMSADRGLMMAGACIVIIPILIFFLLVQKLFVEGMTAGAVKG